MKIILFLNKDLEANIAYNLLKEALSNHDIIIYYSATVGRSDNKPADLVQLEYFEKEFFFEKLPGFLKTNHIETDFEFFGKDFHSTSFHLCNNVNAPSFVQEVKVFEPDLFISIRFGKIFKNEIIQVPKVGLINLHSAILPDYRGIMGTLHALKDNNKEIGCTLHTIPNSGIDTGEIINISRIKTMPNRSVFWHIASLYLPGSQIVMDTLNSLESQVPLISEKQDLKAGSYYSLPTQADFEQVKNRGYTIFTPQDYIDILLAYVVRNCTTVEKQLLFDFINKEITALSKLG